MTSQLARSKMNDFHEQIRSLTDENVQLRDKNEQLFSKLGSLQGKLGTLGASRTDLSSKLVLSEEEKLKMSKELVEVQIRANKMRELYEAENFELKNKLLSQEGMTSALETERDRLRRELQGVSVQAHAAEVNSKELAEEYSTLKRNFLRVCEAYERAATHTEQLSAELLALANTHDTLLQERDHAQRRARQKGEEVERVRALVSRVSHNRVRPEELVALEQTKNPQERNLLGKQSELKNELEKIKKSYEEQQHRLEEKVVAMGKEQQENKRAIRNTQHTLAEQSVALMTSQQQQKELEAENSQLQNQLKELNQEYRARLTKYLQDLTEFMFGLREGLDQKEASYWSKLHSHVDGMLSDMRVAYRRREEQLANAARNYRRKIRTFMNTHTSLLAAYRVQREQILANEGSGLEAGPPEAHFSLGEHEGEAEKELHNLRMDKARLESQLKQTQEQLLLSSSLSQQAQLNDGAWTDIRKQLHEIAITAQESWERERAQLLTQATVAEEQVSELQEYVDNHLGRYKQEITRLRGLLGLGGGRASSAELPKTRLLRRSIKNTSYEI
ncbi:coiled-coil domain-containing protein 78 [Clupea harengus]|uniref:Coiled-coil domain-containing protein 78 n=1 Tax=Clupea harengus TaxID=7950 RepID=A0A6P8EXE7_CLUHA|nr:coiled-coil domain-containing protein 78 [Clupea harengus]XP_042559081.1 coiled-coil domain-containing protein 78 [Clupea harengus]